MFVADVRLQELPGGRGDPERELEPLQRLTRELREHHREHGASEGCFACELWVAYTRRDLQKLEELAAR